MSDGKGDIRRVGDVVDGVMFTEEALRSQDGKTVPLTQEIGGPKIGEAIMRYDEERKALVADFTIDDPDMLAFVRQDPAFIFKDAK